MAKKSTFFQDFKKFIARGNVMDMAVAVVIGGAFGKIVTSLVNDIIMPLVGLATGGMNFADMKYVLKTEMVDGVETVVNSINYGNFIQMIVDFLIVALCIFSVLRVVMKVQKKLEKPAEPEGPAAPAEPVETTDDILKDIRELLKK
ncbi:MAG: large-conductance mechanosensitive channel protein MscL [Clostridia bacterium]|nr:large-conductance mechanosensitive channel protein MscL [Clostridia bacterium]